MNVEFYLAQKLYDAGDTVACEEKCRSILNGGEPTDGVRVLLAQIFYDRGEYETSLDHLDGIESGGLFAIEVSYLGGLNHFARRDFNEARQSFEAVLADAPENGDAWRNLGVIAQKSGDVPEAVSHYCRALDIHPADDLTRRNLLDSLQSIDWRSVARTDQFLDIRHHLEACIQFSDIDTKRYLPVAAAAVLVTPHIREAIELWTVEPQGETNSASDPQLLRAITGDTLFQTLLLSEILCHPDVELIVTKTRRKLLGLVVGDVPEAENFPLEFYASLAHQAFLTEYAYYASDQEQSLVKDLQAELSVKIERGEKLQLGDTTKLLMIASYASLGDWLAGVPPVAEDSALAKVWAQQFQNPNAEIDLERQIEVLSPISDLTSVDVKSQYEQNPFPRWSILRKPIPSTLGETLGNLFPHFKPPARLFEPCTFLIAGCGTGHQPITEALRYPSGQFTAVDLSRASLAYARRQANVHGLNNIRFLEGDILALEGIAPNFDVVACTGVLHHMADPLAGWTALVSRLAPDGVMKIALYSEIARRQIALIRQWIQDRKLPPTADTIRDTRQKILALPADDPKRQVPGFTDFYSISGARDLLFHVQECAFTWPKIREALDLLGLELIGLQLSEPETEAHYRAMFPGDIEMVDLSNWAVFEELYPDSFRQMYQFWCRKIEPGHVAQAPESGQS